MRKSVYFSERLDTDLIPFLEEVENDFSQGVKNLMRDGIKYRKMGDNINEQSTNVLQNNLPKYESVVGDTSHVPKPKVDFSDVVVEKRVLDLSELDDKFKDL